VGNAYQAAHFYRMIFGFRLTAYAGLETGLRDRVSFVLEQGNVRLVLTSAMDGNSPIVEHVSLHGDSVKDIAITVDDATATFENAISRGARPVLEPTVYADSEGFVIKATVGVCGDMVHSFIQRKGFNGTFLPGYRTLNNQPSIISTGLTGIDHIALSVEQTKMDHWIEFYKEVFGFHQSHSEDVSSEYSAMSSKVVQNSIGNIIFPIVEPKKGARKSQIEEYLEFHRGAGVQHIAFSSEDIIGTVGELRSRGIEFLRTPDTYYDLLEGRVGRIKEDVKLLRERSILVDRDSSGYLMQIFTKPLQSRPTVFFEVIQRNGSRGFGSGNIKALFESIEREQALREALL
jgi:4-hydroxyphenylpyruvate dioxygenase